MIVRIQKYSFSK